MEETVATKDPSFLFVRQNSVENAPFNAFSQLDSVTHFCKSYVFSIWLRQVTLKTLETRASRVIYPWWPSEEKRLLKTVYETILIEEVRHSLSDEIKSQFELFRESLGDLTSEPPAVDRFLTEIKKGAPLTIALARTEIQDSTKDFVKAVNLLLSASTLELMALFCVLRDESFLKTISDNLEALEYERGKPISHLREYLQVSFSKETQSSIEQFELLLSQEFEKEPSKREVVSRFIERATTIQLEFFTGIQSSFKPSFSIRPHSLSANA